MKARLFAALWLTFALGAAPTDLAGGVVAAQAGDTVDVLVDRQPVFELLLLLLALLLGL